MKLNCKQCNKEFEKYPSQVKAGEGKYCSKSCYTQSMKNTDLFTTETRGKRPQIRVKIDCKVCNKSFEIVPSKIGVRKYCSMFCYLKDNVAKNKDLHWLRMTTWYKNWRLEVYSRDGFRCQSCGQVGKNLNAHHIIPVAVNILKIFDVSNGITLCEKCHRAVHKSYRPNCKQGELLGSLIEIISSQAKQECLEGSQTRKYGVDHTMNSHECPASKDDDIVGAYRRL